jgi:hypothetical protein
MIMVDVPGQVQELYVAYFGRPADPAGLQFWSNVFATPGGYDTIVNAFSHSDEYKATVPNMDSRTLVDTVYEHVFGRHAETGGLDFWSGMLNKGAITIDDVVANVAASAQGSDSLVFDAKVDVATLFTSHLDTLAERVAYMGSSANAMAAAYLAAITDAASAATALDPANIDALISKMTEGHQLPETVSVDAHLIGVMPADVHGL